MTLSDLSIRRPVFAWMLMAGLIVFGAIGLSRLGISEQPDVDFPVLTVNVAWTGAAPTVMETAIVDPLESTLISTEGIRTMSSNIQLGQASITLEFDLSRNIDSALTEVQSKISSVRLPIGAQQATIDKTNPEDEPIVILAVSGGPDRSLHALTAYIEETLADKFKTLPGVGQVVLGGYDARNLRLWVDNEKLKAYELTILDVQTALTNEHLETAAGYLENNRRQMNIRMMGEGMTADEVGAIRIRARGGETIYNSDLRIRDVARVEDGLDDIRHLGLAKGKESLAIAIKKQRGANAVAVGDAVKARLVEIAPGLPSDIHIEPVFDTTHFIRDAIHETLFTLVLSGLVTGLVCYLFLGSWTSTLNVLLSIPTSVMGTFVVIYFLGFTLNFFTLLGLSLAIGIIVDDSIMVLENIVRHAEQGKDRVTASRDGAREITFAAVAATAAVSAIFLPVAFMSGIIGKFFFQFGVTISAAVLLSLIEAITITPMRCSRFLTVGKSTSRMVRYVDDLFHRSAVTYRKYLGLALDRRWLVIAASVGVLLLSLIPAYLLRKEFTPPQDQSAFLIHVETPIGSSIEYTSQKLTEAEKILESHAEIAHYFAVVGGFSLTGGANEGDLSENQINVATIYVTLVPKGSRSLGQFEVMNKLRQELGTITDLKAVPQDLASRSFTSGRGFPIEMNIRGDDYAVLESLSNSIIARLQASGEMADFNTDLRNGMNEIRLYPDRQEAAKSGVTVATIVNTVSAAIGGVAQGQFTNGDRRYDVRLRLEGTQRANSDDLLKLQVRTSGNELIPITRVVRLEDVRTYQTLTREMRERSVTIYANVTDKTSQSRAMQTAQRVAWEEIAKLPKDGKNYRLFFGGGAETFQETFSSLTFALWLGIIVAYMILAAQFNSFIHPLAVLLALPFSLSGAFIALYVTGQSLNMYSMIGLVLLMGIVKKNSILLVEFSNRKRFVEGLPLREAILEAGPVRLRPILMTSLATLAAALPPALAIGPGAESRIPLAVTVIGGVIVSTSLTLFVVPCAYSLMASLEGKDKDVE
ncbi:hydrophobic/amphiphilic exporter-1, HAE1 family [Verrucomicrobium sp. GAS474]|uniref:efflux RND transporter permease subunit n=1 Tax=Verrucomicrobium sp. GAS474 TaxID=1882831 RepID=UPI00087AC3F2|nr:efflux RND transporter permease subunit [Verrucomicrobium sp. GAS474]SDU20581.1 hydrophobic/amphiphilic exporter-1, HAE1 family [Verrucomicrobium sp. GAS474]